MRKIIQAVLLLILLPGLSAYGAPPSYPLTFLTEDNPPFNYSEKGVPRGMAVDVLHRMWEKLGETKKEIQVVPWSRGYEAAQTKPGTVLFVTARLPAREKLFKWVGPITMTRLILLSAQNSDIQLPSEQELRKYRIGVLKNDYSEIIMKAFGVPEANLDIAPDYKTSVLKLAAGRIDLMVKGEKSLDEFLRSINQDPADFKVVRRIAGAQVSFAFHKDTPDAVIRQYQSALNALRAEGMLEKIVRQYQPD